MESGREIISPHNYGVLCTCSKLKVTRSLSDMELVASQMSLVKVDIWDFDLVNEVENKVEVVFFGFLQNREVNGSCASWIESLGGGTECCNDAFEYHSK